MYTNQVLASLFIILLLILGYTFLNYMYPSEATSQITVDIENTTSSSRALKQVVSDVKNSVSQSVNETFEKVTTSGPLKVFNPIYGTNITKSGTILETNIARALGGRMPLAENQLLNLAAQQKAEDMLLRQYFEHESPDGKGPADIISETGYQYITVGENLALGHFKDDKVLVTAWMNSPGHRENILNQKFTEIGIGIAKGQYNGQTVWVAVQEFGKPSSLCPSVDKVLGQSVEENKALMLAKEAKLENLKKEIESLNKNSKAYKDNISIYNDLVSEYNALIKETKEMIDTYNASVNAYNVCVQS